MKLKDTLATLTYVTAGGYYVILQTSVCEYTGEDEDMRIILSPEQMRLIVADMETTLLSADEWWSIQDTEGEV